MAENEYDLLDLIQIQSDIRQQDYSDLSKEQVELFDPEKCPLCSQDYQLDKNLPRILPQCGHCFCSLCVGLLIVEGTLSCPMCSREIQDIAGPMDFPVNQQIF